MKDKTRTTTLNMTMRVFGKLQTIISVSPNIKNKIENEIKIKTNKLLKIIQVY